MAALFGLTISSAHAVTVTYTFDTTEEAAFGSSPFGTVKLVENGSNVDVTVSLRSDLNFVVTGGPHTIFTFNAAGIVVSDITNIVFAGFPVGGILTVLQDPNAEANPFGRFLFGIDCVDVSNQDKCKQGGPTGWVDPLTFTVLNATAADFEYRSFVGGKKDDPWVESVDGYYFGADVICVATLLNGCTKSGATASIAVSGSSSSGGSTSGGNQVPEPASSLVLLGLGMLGLGFVRRGKQTPA